MKAVACALLLISLDFCVTQSLRSLTGNRYVGAGILPDWLKKTGPDAEYATIVDREFNCVTPGNAMKWDAVEGQRGHTNYADGDYIVSHAKQHNMRVRGHTLVWHEQQPGWVKNGQFSASEMEALLKAHVQAEVSHYKGQIYAWDVVNEALEYNGSYRHSNYYNTIGQHYLADAFRWAHEADPAAKLYYNDYGAEGINSKSNGMLQMVKEFKAAGVPIHGVGLQSHFSVGHIPADLQKNMERFAALDVDVALTELDIAINLPATKELLDQQAKDYAQVFHACLAVPRCVGITIWGFTDKESWIPSVSNGKAGAALIYDEHYKEKPAYTAIQKALQGH